RRSRRRLPRGGDQRAGPAGGESGRRHPGGRRPGDRGQPARDPVVVPRHGHPARLRRGGRPGYPRRLAGRRAAALPGARPAVRAGRTRPGRTRPGRPGTGQPPPMSPAVDPPADPPDGPTPDGGPAGDQVDGESLGVPPEVLRARALILRYGWNATAYQLLNPGFALWFSAAGDAVVGYVRRRGVNVVAGAPVCAVERLTAVHEEFAAASRAGRARICYFGAGHRLEEELRTRSKRSVVLLGAQPVWNPADFAGIVGSHASLRAQLHRARNKQVAVTEWPAERVRAEPALARVLAEWLATRGLPPLSFLVEPDTLGR